jgi:hypothetical protein
MPPTIPQEASTDIDTSAGLAGGIVVLVLTPLIVALFAVLAYYIINRRKLLGVMGRPEAGAKYTAKELFVFWLLPGLVLAISLAGVGVSIYAIVSFTSFQASTAQSDAVFNAVLERVANVSAYSAIDCSIADSDDLAGTNVCFCEAVNGVWQCANGYSVVNGVVADCVISASEMCECSLELRPLGAIWSCLKLPFNLTVNAANTQDFGLRFIPGGIGNNISSVVSQGYFSSLPATDAAQNYTFSLLFAEPIPVPTPIIIALAFSLALDIIGLLYLGVAALVEWAKSRGKIRKEFGRTSCLGRKVNLFPVFDLVLMGIGLLLFGVVLVVAFTNPILNVSEARVQPVDLRHDVGGLSEDASPTLSSYASLFCRCPVSFNSSRGCSVASGGSSLEFTSDVILNVPGVTFGCPVTIQGTLLASSSAVFQHDLTVSGSITLDASIIVGGTLTSSSGSISGSVFSLSALTPKVYGDVRAPNGALTVSSAGEAFLQGIGGRIRVRDFAYSGAKVHFGLGAITANLEPILHTTQALILPNNFQLTIYGGYPFSDWQASTIVLGSSDLGVNLQGNNSTETAFVWDYLAQLALTGGCGALTPFRTTTFDSSVGVTVTLSPPCPFTSPAPMFGYNYQSQAASIEFAEASTTPRYQLQNVPDDLLLPFNFVHQFCGSEVAYRREVDWIETLKLAFNTTELFSICPAEKIVLDPANNCVTYTCDGSFALPARFSQGQVANTQNLILGGIAIDAVATVLDVFGTGIELLLIPFLATGSVTESAISMSTKPWTGAL